MHTCNAALLRLIRPIICRNHQDDQLALTLRFGHGTVCYSAAVPPLNLVPQADDDWAAPMSRQVTVSACSKPSLASLIMLSCRDHAVGCPSCTRQGSEGGKPHDILTRSAQVDNTLGDNCDAAISSQALTDTDCADIQRAREVHVT